MKKLLLTLLLLSAVFLAFGRYREGRRYPREWFDDKPDGITDRMGFNLSLGATQGSIGIQILNTLLLINPSYITPMNDFRPEIDVDFALSLGDYINRTFWEYNSVHLAYLFETGTPLTPLVGLGIVQKQYYHEMYSDYDWYFDDGIYTVRGDSEFSSTGCIGALYQLNDWFYVTSYFQTRPASAFVGGGISF
jgi:hypothetical protein